MKNKHTLFCFVGESGAGKTTIVNELEKKGYKVLNSYTTRKPRYKEEKGHIFCTVEEYEKFKKNNQIAGYSYFNNNHYFSTIEQVLTSDLYVVDPDGIIALKEAVPNLNIIIFYIVANEGHRVKRMEQRRDSKSAIDSRLANDKIKFANVFYDYKIKNNDLERTLTKIESIIKSVQKEEIVSVTGNRK